MISEGLDSSFNSTQSSINNSSIINDSTFIKTGPDAHFDYFRQWYDYVNDYSIVRRAKETYDTAKHSSPMVEGALSKVENGVHAGLTEVAAPLYANYCYPTTDRLVDLYSKGLDTTKSAVDKTVSVATHTGTLSLGLAIVTAQMGLIATTSATNLFLSSLILTKNAGTSAIQGVQSAEKAVENRIRDALDYTVKVAKVPADKITEHTNTFLDLANAAFDKLLGLPNEKEPIESTIPERIRYLTRRVAGGLNKRAHDTVIDPVAASVHGIIQQLNQKVLLADFIKQRREWATEHVGNLSTNMLELKKKVEHEASQFKISPEEVLVNSIRKTSQKLNDNFSRLRDQGNELIGESVATKIDAATSYVQQLDSSLQKAENIYQIRDEVLVEAKQKIGEMAQWTASLLVREDQSSRQSTIH